MSASNHDAGMSLAARTAAAASAAAKQLGSVLGLTRQSPLPAQAPPSPPTSIATASSGLSGVLEELRIAEDEKKDKDCEREEEETVAVKDEGSGAVDVGGKAGRMGEEKQKKARKDRGKKASAANAFPQRPVEPDCAFYIKTGRCDYGQSCRFNHPPDRWNRTKAQRQGTPASEQVSNASLKENRDRQQGETRKCKFFASPMGCKYGNACIYSHCVEKVEAEIELNFLGLPMRPGEQECPLYLETGACQDSTYCKYHHPNPTAFGDTDQPSEFFGSSTSLPPDFGNASWVSESATYGLHPYMGASLLYLQGMPAMHQVPPLNNDWHTYQASMDPHFYHGRGHNLVTATEEDTECKVNGKDHPGATNDCKGNQEVAPVSTYSIMTEGKDGDKDLRPAISGATKTGASAKHLPVFNANDATVKKGSPDHTPVGTAVDTSTGKATGKISAAPFLSVPLEASKGKKKQKQVKQPPSANSHNVTKSRGSDKPVSIPNNNPKKQGKEQPPVSSHYQDTERMGSKKETTFHFASKGARDGKKAEVGINYDGSKEKEYEKQPIKGKGSGSNFAINCGKESQPTKSKKNVKQCSVASAHYAPIGKTKEEQHPVSLDHDDSDSKRNINNPTKIGAKEIQPNKSKKNAKHSSVAVAHHVLKGNAKEDQHPVFMHRDESDSKINGSSPTRNSGNESQSTKSKKNENHPVPSVYYIPKGKGKELQHLVSTDHEEFDGKGGSSNIPKNSGNESQPGKSKNNEKHSSVASTQYVPKVKANMEQHPVSTDHDDSDGKENGNQISVCAPMISVSARKKGKQPPVATSHDSTDAYVCGKDSLHDVPASSAVKYDKVSGKAPDDVISLDVTAETEDRTGKPPTQLTELLRRPGQPECPFYLKKGGCKYRSCKFDHPKDPNHIQSSSKCLLSPKGLPLRPGLPICTHYSQSGICTYGPACRYHHPMDVIPSPTVAK